MSLLLQLWRLLDARQQGSSDERNINDLTPRNRLQISLASAHPSTKGADSHQLGFTRRDRSGGIT